MKKLGKSILALALCATTGLSMMACNGEVGTTGDETTTKIVFRLQNGGLGRDWLDSAFARFAELKKDYSYAPGKKGVSLEVEMTGSVDLKTAATDGTNIYALHQVASLSKLVDTGDILCIDDIITADTDMRNGEPISIEDKMPEAYRQMYKGSDNQYYAVPGCEYFPGLAYDIGTFEDIGLYLANPNYQNEADAQKYYSEVLQQDFYFLYPNSDASMRTCGPDGKTETAYDNGLPSSIYEFIALCEFMSSQGVTPISFAGAYVNYSNFMLSGLMASLQGYDRANSMYTLDGEVDIVVGFENTPLYPGVPSIKKPIVKKVQMTEETGYYASWSVEKYYAESVLELCMLRGWLDNDCYDSNITQKMIMQNFIFNDVGDNHRRGMLAESTFWYNEANISGYFKMYDQASGFDEYKQEKKLGWMSLPVTFDTPVSEGEGDAQTWIETWREMYVINANIKDNVELMNACKDLIVFLNTDAELSKYTMNMNLTKPLIYDVAADDYDNMSVYGRYLYALKKDAKPIYFSANNETFQKNSAVFDQSYESGYFSYKTYNSYFVAREGNTLTKSCDEVFVGQAYTKQQWKAIYAGNGTAGEGGVYDSIVR